MPRRTDAPVGVDDGFAEPFSPIRRDRRVSGTRRSLLDTGFAGNTAKK